MSLIFDDPEKYFELLDRLAQEEKNFQNESLDAIKNAKDDQLLAALKWVGLTLSEIRISQGYTLRKFVTEEFKDQEGLAYKISNIERGMQIPSSEVFQKYINLLRKNKSNE
jgi:hypothetical protein